MRKILLSLVTILAVGAMTVGATSAVFSSQATLDDNTFATGSLEIRLNGLAVLPGFNFTGAKPGDTATKVFDLQNYGAPWFSGPSTLDAEEIVATSQQDGGDTDLYNALTAKLYANAGWSGCSTPGVEWVPGKGCTVFNGDLHDLSADILRATQWGLDPVLAHGNSLTMTLDVTIPLSADDSLQGKSTVFDLLFNAYTPHR